MQTPDNVVTLNKNSGTITKEDLTILKAPFSDETLGVKVQSFNRDRTKAMLVLYLQHTDVQDRLEQVDPAWTFSVVHQEKLGDTFIVRCQMTVKGVVRENVGEGQDPKSAYSDALKRCAMLFGVGRFLYDSQTVWVPYNDTIDKYRSYTVEEYRKATSKKAPEHPKAVTIEPRVAPHRITPEPSPFDFNEAPSSLGAVNPPKIIPVPCQICGTTLKLSKAGTSYYCPNFKKPDHEGQKPMSMQEWSSYQFSGEDDVT